MVTDHPLDHEVYPWLSTAWQHLAEAIAEDRAPQSLLIAGPIGIGKGALARQLAMTLLCESHAPLGPCGTCHACGLFLAGSHPDFFLAHPGYGEIGEDPESADDSATQKKGKKGKAPSKQIRVDCIRDLIHFATHAAHQQGRRVALVEPAEAMNASSANALLKTLEEPGEGMHIILVAHQATRLLPTVRSRCQLLDCTIPPVHDAHHWLAERVAAERASTALRVSRGAPLRALAAVQADADLAWREVMIALETCRDGSVHYLYAGEILARYDTDVVLEWWLDRVLEESRQQLHPARLRFADQLLDARRKCQSTANPNARFLFESLLVDWISLA